MVHVLPVVAVVVGVGAFLVAVGRIVCRIEVQEHTLWSFILLAPLPDVELQESLGHPVAVADANRVLQAREGELACEVLLIAVFIAVDPPAQIGLWRAKRRTSRSFARRHPGSKEAMGQHHCTPLSVSGSLPHASFKSGSVRKES